MRTGIRLLLAALAVLVLHASAASAYVYWTENTGTAIARANNDGSGVIHAFAPANTPEGLAVDSNYLYWGNGGSTIGRANKNGTGADPTFIPSPGGPVSAIATDGTYIYWADGSGHIGRALLNGSQPNPNFINAGGTTGALTIADGTIYFEAGGEISSVPASGGSPSPLVTIPGNPTVVAMATGGGYVYWSYDTLTMSGNAGIIGAASIGNPADVNQALVQGPQLVVGIATDGTYLYWAQVESASGPGVIERAMLNGGTQRGTPSQFATEPDNPAAIALDGGIDPTTTAVSCTPATVSSGMPSACTARVTDSASTAIPTGTVNFTGARGAFFQGGPCQLTADGGGGASCTVGANPTVSGTQAVTATYSGDAVHGGSSGQTSICSGACATGGSPARCVVPKLKGKTLSQARTLLRRARCSLGKVTKPKHAHGRLVVTSSSPRAGERLAAGAKVAVRLAQPKRTRRRR